MIDHEDLSVIDIESLIPTAHSENQITDSNLSNTTNGLESINVESINRNSRRNLFQVTNINSNSNIQSVTDIYSLTQGSSNKGITDNEFQSIIFSNFMILVDGINDSILRNILTYLNSYDLSRLAITSKYMSKISKSDMLWSALYKIDFNPLDQEFEIPQSLTITTWNANANTKLNSTPTATKDLYIKRYNDLNEQMQQSRNEKLEFEVENLRLERVKRIEDILDLLFVRLMMPLSISAMFLSIILLCQKFDGLNISYWVCTIPIIFIVIYSVVLIQLAKVAYLNQYKSSSILKGLWNNMRGPVVFFFNDIIAQSLQLMNVTILVFLLSLLQILLVATKLSSSTSETVQHNLSWGVVFIPIWCLFALFCLTPLTKLFEPSAFFLAIVTIWTPLFILFVCLTIKFNGHDNDNQDQSIRLAYILMPFWILEGFLMISGVVLLVSGIYRYRRGLIERIDEHIAVFAMTWMALTPLVIFQALFCVRDDAQIGYHMPYESKHNVPTATEVVIPIVIVLGWVYLVSCFASWTYKTAFQVLPPSITSPYILMVRDYF